MGRASRSSSLRTCQWCGCAITSSAPDLMEHAKVCEQDVMIRQRLEAAGLVDPGGNLYVPKPEG